jgi:hypothetical protein
VEKAMFELRNMMGLAPEAPLRLKDELSNLIAHRYHRLPRQLIRHCSSA